MQKFTLYIEEVKQNFQQEQKKYIMLKKKVLYLTFLLIQQKLWLMKMVGLVALSVLRWNLVNQMLQEEEDLLKSKVQNLLWTLTQLLCHLVHRQTH